MSGETLYNGIRLPADWPPLGRQPSRTPEQVPWLRQPPPVIPVDVGRQLFVDDFLIEKTTMQRRFHRPMVRSESPVLKPETTLELNQTEMARRSIYGPSPVAAPFQDGVFYDPLDQTYKMFYMAGWFDGTALALSRDGLRWERPDFGVVPGTNQVIVPRRGLQRDGGGVWLDPVPEHPEARFKMFLFVRDRLDGNRRWGEVRTSPDGIHWSEPLRTSVCGDNTSIGYNPFRRKWIYSIRTVVNDRRLYVDPEDQPPGERAVFTDPVFRTAGRTRAYRECDDFVTGRLWTAAEVRHWASADDLDFPDPEIGDPTELYALDMVGYESIMLGGFLIFRGPDNKFCREWKQPKMTDMTLAYSRDGFHWHRPEREPFLASSRQPGTWNYGYLHGVGSLCTIAGAKLRFYFSAWSGRGLEGPSMYGGGATGVAELRRDGFASMETGPEGGELLTRPISFCGSKLFVNVDCPDGALRAEVLDEAGRVMEGFGMEECRALRMDSVKCALQWAGETSLARLAGRPVRLRFRLDNGALYAFWISKDSSGASGGFPAGGLDERGLQDMT